MILLILTCVIIGNANVLLIRLKSHPNAINVENENLENGEQNQSGLGQDYGYDLIESQNQDYKGYDGYFGDYKGYDEIFGNNDEMIIFFFIYRYCIYSCFLPTVLLPHCFQLLYLDRSQVAHIKLCSS